MNISTGGCDSCIGPNSLEARFSNEHNKLYFEFANQDFVMNNYSSLLTKQSLPITKDLNIKFVDLKEPAVNNFCNIHKDYGWNTHSLCLNYRDKCT